jgi:hypothetical protein
MLLLVVGAALIINPEAGRIGDIGLRGITP